jgi:SRSO17 transposase
VCEESFRAGHLPAGGPALPTPRKPTPPTTAAIDAFCAQFDALFCRSQERVAFRHYLIGLLLPREHNQTIVEVAAIVPSANRQALHHSRHDAPWDAATLNRRRLERWQAHPYLRPHAGGVLIVDETGDPKRGHRIVLAARSSGASWDMWPMAWWR